MPIFLQEFVSSHSLINSKDPGRALVLFTRILARANCPTLRPVNIKQPEHSSWSVLTCFPLQLFNFLDLVSKHSLKDKKDLLSDRIRNALCKPMAAIVCCLYHICVPKDYWTFGHWTYCRGLNIALKQLRARVTLAGELKNPNLCHWMVCCHDVLKSVFLSRCQRL